MAVVVVQGGEVILVLRDVETVQDAFDKYPTLAGKLLVEGNHPVGTRWGGGQFTVPPVPTTPPHPEEETVLALRDLADIIGPAAVAKIESRFGSRRP